MRRSRQRQKASPFFRLPYCVCIEHDSRGGLDAIVAERKYESICRDRPGAPQIDDGRQSLKANRISLRLNSCTCRATSSFPTPLSPSRDR